MPVDRPTIALAGVRAARGELCRAAGLLHQAIRAAAGEGIAAERVARAAGTSVDEVQRIARAAHERRGGSAVLRSDRGGSAVLRSDGDGSAVLRSDRDGRGDAS
jgi:hypothetical protein